MWFGQRAEIGDFTLEGWQLLTKIAKKHGWVPRGTQEPPDWDSSAYGKWDGGYDTFDGQIVTQEDADAMSDGLMAAVLRLERKLETEKAGEDPDPLEVSSLEYDIHRLYDIALSIGLGGDFSLG
jgi:hypothetical protein